jgi:hypothetical protein
MIATLPPINLELKSKLMRGMISYGLASKAVSNATAADILKNTPPYSSMAVHGRSPKTNIVDCCRVCANGLPMHVSDAHQKKPHPQSSGKKKKEMTFTTNPFYLPAKQCYVPSANDFPFCTFSLYCSFPHVSKWNVICL